MLKNSTFGVTIRKYPTSVLVVDPSASHLAYAVVTFHSEKDLEIVKCGMIWAQSTWHRGRRFHYIYRCMQALMHSIPTIDGIVTEAFFANPKLLGSSAVIPTINGIIEMVADMNSVSEVGYPVFYEEIPPTQWRKLLDIKPVTVNGKRDYKVPAHDMVVKTLGELPKSLISNVTGKERDLPHDITDCLCISLAMGKHLGYDKIRLSNSAFNNKEDLETFKDMVIRD